MVFALAYRKPYPALPAELRIYLPWLAKADRKAAAIGRSDHYTADSY
jgi:hypothetical protein